MRKTLVAALMAGVALPAYSAYAADLSGGLSGGYIGPSDPVLAPTPMVMGHLDIGFGYLDISEASEDIWLFQGAGRANVDLGSFNIEIETGGGSLIFDGGSSFSSIGTAAHLWGKFNNAALGVYGAVNFPTSATVYTIGLEGEYYLGSITLGADIDYNWVDTGGGNTEFWSTSGWADFYLTPDARIGGEINYMSNNDIDLDVWGASLDAEYRFSGTPVSLWAEGNYQSVDVGGGDGDIWSALIGFRLFIDGNRTLHEHDMYVPWDSGLLQANNFLFGGS